MARDNSRQRLKFGDLETEGNCIEAPKLDIDTVYDEDAKDMLMQYCYIFI